MSTVKPLYSSSGSLTITLDALATDANLLVGRASTAIDNTSNRYLDVFISGKIVAGTSPTADKVIEIWAYGQLEDTPTYPDSITGSDAGKTMTSANVKALSLRHVISLPTDNTSSRVYNFGPILLAPVFGGVLPKLWGIWVAHSMGVNLGSGCAIYYQPLQLETV